MFCFGPQLDNNGMALSEDLANTFATQNPPCFKPVFCVVTICQFLSLLTSVIDRVGAVIVLRGLVKLKGVTEP